MNLLGFIFPFNPIIVSVPSGRPFHTTPIASQDVTHPLYRVIDWTIVQSGKYAVVDPIDPEVILYLSSREYIIQSRVCMSNDYSLIVLATPKSHPLPPSNDEKPSKNSPPLEGFILQDIDFSTSKGRRERLRFLFSTPFLHFLKREKIVKGDVPHKPGPKPVGPSVPSGNPVELGETIGPKGDVICDPSAKSKPDISTISTLERMSKAGKWDRMVEYESMIVVNEGNFINIIRKWGSILHFRLFGLGAAKGFSCAIVDFSSHLLCLYKNNGIKVVISRMKIYLHVLLCYVSGKQVRHTNQLDHRIRMRHGLPAAFPPSTRFAIRAKCTSAIRAWTSLLGMYKGLRGEWDAPDYRSVIQSPLKTAGNGTFDDFASYCEYVFFRFLPPYFDSMGEPSRKYPVDPLCLRTTETYVSTKGGPNGPSLESSHWDLVCWLVRAGHELGYFKGRTITVKPPTILKISMSDWLDSPYHPFKDFMRWSIQNIASIEKILPWGQILLITKDHRARPALTTMLEDIKALDLRKIATVFGNPITTYAPNLDVDPWSTRPRRVPEKKLVNLKKFNKDNPYMPETVPYPPKKGTLPPSFVSNPGTTPVLEPIWAQLPENGGLNLARTCALYEPAGKVRTIVLFDWVSQHILLPFHNLLFGYLKLLPTDVTFDQDGGLKSFTEQGHKYIASYDLRNATESISMILYKVMLTPILGSKLTNAWANLMQDRPVAISKDASRYRWGSHIRYCRGQPMGALSSWACMSLLHHAIVQFCAYSIQWGGHVNKYEWFKNYLVLGDDIIIADEGVAQKYLSVCSDLGISIGLPKSFESHEGFLNFAGQSYLASENLSPISFKEELSARSPGTRIEMALRLIKRGHIRLTQNGWLSGLLRSVLSRSVYKQTCDYLRAGKGVHYAVRTVLMTVCARLDHFPIPGLLSKNEISENEHDLSVFGYAALIGGTGNLFSESLDVLLHKALKSDSPRLNEIVLAIVFQKAKTVQRRFLSIQPIYDNWKTNAVFAVDGSISNPESFLPKNMLYIRPLLKRYRSFGLKLSALLEWEETYYSTILLIIKHYGESDMTVDSFETRLSTPLSVLFGFLIEADKALPIKPENVLGEQTKLRVLDVDDIYHQASARYALWENLLHLGSAVDREPDLSFSVPWSENSHILRKTN